MSHRHTEKGYTEAEWLGAQGDPVLLERELAFITDTGEHVLGDGVTPLSNLTRYGGENGASDAQRAALHLDHALVYDTFTRADSTTSLGDAESGQTWVVDAVSGALGISSNRAYHASGSGRIIATIDTGVADVDMSATLSVTGDGHQGLVIRATDVNNLISVDLRPSTVRILKRESGTGTQLASASRSHVTGKRYDLRARVVGDVIEVFVNGHRELTHTLTGGDETTFGGITDHGFIADQSSSPTFDDFFLRSA